MILYSQRDPKWRSLQVGSAGRPMAQIGCVVTAIAMLTTYFRPMRSPADVLRHCRFTPDGRIIWASCNFENFRWYQRVYVRHDQGIKQHIKHPNLAVVLQVADRTHWVVGIGVPLFGGPLRIADPLLGDRASMSRYQDNITGAAYFIRK